MNFIDRDILTIVAFPPHLHRPPLCSDVGPLGIEVIGR